MKKILSVLLCIVLSFSMITLTAYAADGNASITVSNNNVKVNDEFTVTVNIAAFTRYTDQYYLCYDKTALEITQVADHKGRVNGVDSKFACSIVFDEEFTTPYTLAFSNSNDDIKGFATGLVENNNVNWTSSSAESREGAARAGFAVVTFKALKAGTTKVTMVEGSYRADANLGYNGINQVETITVAGNEPEAPEVGTGANNGEKAKKWTVTVPGGYLATKNNVLKATLTNKDLNNDTQEVTINVTGEGAATWVFDVNVTFTNPNYRANTDLTVE